jgi:hypothetical protein
VLPVGGIKKLTSYHFQKGKPINFPGIQQFIGSMEGHDMEEYVYSMINSELVQGMMYSDEKSTKRQKKNHFQHKSICARLYSI